MDLALTRAENVGLLRTLSVFDGRNVSSDLRRDAVKCDGLTACSPFSESTNEFSKTWVRCFLIAQNRESNSELGPVFWFMFLPMWMQQFNAPALSKRTLQSQALRLAAITHEWLHHAVVRNRPEETFK